MALVKTVTLNVTALTDRANRDITATGAYFEKLRAANPVELSVKFDRLQAIAESKILAREMSQTVRDTVKLDADRSGLGGIPGLGRLFRSGTGPGAGLPGALGGIPGIGTMPPAGIAGIAAGALAALPLLAQAAAGAITFGLGAALTGIGVYAEKGVRSVQYQFAQLVSGKQGIQATLSNISPAFGQALTTILNAARTFIPTFIRDFGAPLNAIAGPFKSLGVEIAGSLASPQVADSLKALGQAFGGILKALTPAIPGIVTAIADGFTNLFRAVEKNPKAITELITGLGHLLGIGLDVLGWLTNIADYLEHHWKEVLTGVIAPVIDHWRGLATFFDDFRHRTAVIFDGIRHDIAHWWDLAWDETVGRLTRGIGDANRLLGGWETSTGRFIDGIVSFFTGLPRRALNALSGFGNALNAFAKQALHLFLEGLESVASSITGWLSGFWHGLLGLGKKLLGIGSPSKAFYEMGRQTMQGFAAGIRDHASLASAAVTGAVGGAVTGAAGGSVTSWITSALRATGTPMSWLAGMTTLVMKESGGNPRAYNPQVAGASGEHAEGIAQTIPSTFAAYGLGGSIWNPVADLIASVRYIRAVYGSVYNIQGITGGFYGGYDQGGWLMPGATLALNKTGSPELVTPGRKLDELIAAVRENTDVLAGCIDQLTAVTADAPARTGAGLGAALSLGARSAQYSALYP